ncbi:SH2 domain protein [Dictyocaulus viviparus]|uniref:SH2 domain protein n=1 Tax=Dictyocaulus viviparus TaxID=29172 RepID=A0A0D8Y5A6_DICVI|nr:SH2 domain protein [Dictyocaulus viviparus]
MKHVFRLLTENGQFLVRVTEPRKDMGFRTVLSSRWQDKNYHFVIGENRGNYFIDKETFPDINTLIQYYVREHKPLTEKSGVILLTPVMRQKWELKHDWITLDRFLGEGEFGEVYAGTLNLGMNTYKVAVKVHKGSSLEKEAIAEICKEARIMRHYRHENVIKFYGVAVEKDPLMLVMELVSGGALDNLLRSKKDDLSQHELATSVMLIILDLIGTNLTAHERRKRNMYK